MRPIENDPWQTVFKFRPVLANIAETHLREVITAAISGKSFDLAKQDNGYWRVRLNPTQWRGKGMSVQSNIDSATYGRTEIEQALRAAGIDFDT